MNRFSRLLENQTLTICNHHSGLPHEWGKGLHIDKRFHKGKRQGFTIMFPLDNDMDIKFTPKGDTRAPEVLKEITEVLKGDSIRNQFADAIYQAIEQFKNSRPTIDEVRKIAHRIAYNFGIDGEIVSEIIEIHNKKEHNKNQIDRHSSLIEAEDTGKRYEITQTENKINIKEENRLYGAYFNLRRNKIKKSPPKRKRK